ncbi:serine/threonine-protein kinase [Fibrella arboris]|uniref:serine/threonine-protein kinase n=1 Tax=Fibrella arboris TaxID=3242486 RepID=UPI0035206B1F
MPTVSFNTNFPGYDVLGEIGRSNARVLKARHIASGDLVAIKHFALNTDADTLRRFERESEIMSRMSNPNVVRVREVRLAADLPYIVLDYIEGGNVRQLIAEQGGLSVELTIRLGLQMINAFRQIHAQGIIHRDVKPENILYHRLASGELHFLLTDFGVARLHEQPVTMTGQSLMTYEYAAPEQFDNPRNITTAVDYYALGVVFYECLTGKVPFAMRGETGIVTFMNAVLTTPPPTPVLSTAQPLPSSLVRLIKQLLVKNPTERIQHPDEVRLILKQAEVEQLQGENGQEVPAVVNRTETYQPAAPRVIPRSHTEQPTSLPANVASRRRRSLIPIIALVGALLLASLGTYWFINKPKPSRAKTPMSTTARADESLSDLTLPTGEPSDETVPTDSTQTSAALRQPTETGQREKLEAAHRQYDEQVAVATKQLNAEAFGGKVGLLGGVRGLTIQLRNPSTILFTSVAVRVKYIKESGDLYKSTVMYFNQIAPNATVVRVAPDSPRGTRFSAEVIRADALSLDSLGSTTPHIP